MILLVAPPDDRHAAAVADRLRARGEDAALIDVASLTAQLTIGLEFAPGLSASGSVQVHGLDGATTQTIDLSRVTAGWWRRSWIPLLGADDPRLTGAPVDFGEALVSTAEALDIAWANEPVAVDLAQRRTRLWASARRAGLIMPHTIVTHDPGAAHRFAKQHLRTGVVCRPLVKSHAEWPAQDRIMGVSAIDELVEQNGPDLVLRAFVPGSDLRAFVAGDRVLAADLGPTATNDPGAGLLPVVPSGARAVELPVEVRDGLAALVADLGLGHAAVDLRRTRAGEHLFLDLDPLAGWLDVEAVTGLPLTEQLVDELLARSAARVA
ncbi:hypothetical protein GCM10027515_16250 [Schumannella luteola]|uniref:ATP-grasp domain-containing protein n=1 Tax=Schumannella luteola TaxID=472059 RepID=A0A852YTE0_9MICO|nr:hypothetical protein [Schumannella luteola]NYH00576.1 hypothetical protein [Schumannella luteola]TPX04961.1 hypothetical protein FJ656_09305 [Schumannella luteola]